MNTSIRRLVLLVATLFALPALADSHHGGGRGGGGEKVHGKANHHMHKTDFEDLIRGFESPDRITWQKPGEIIDRLEPLGGKTVADIGAGSGYFSFRIAAFAEKVIAIDVDRRMLEYMDAKKNDEGIGKNIETRLTGYDDPGLENDEADIVLIVNTYHHIENRSAYLEKVRKGMKAGGRLVIVDYFKRPLPLGPPPEIKLGPSEAVAELQAAGFDAIHVDEELLDYQYMVVGRN